MLKLVASRAVIAAVILLQSIIAFADSPELLVLDRSVTVTQSADQTYTYRFDADAGETYLIEVDQQNLDFIVTVEELSGDTHSFNSPLFRDEREFVLLEDTQPGSVWIKVYSDEFTGLRGIHTISVRQLSPTTDSDLIAAWRLISDGAQANFQGGEQQWQRSLEFYNSAVDAWDRLDRPREKSQALFSSAYLMYWRLYRTYDWLSSAELAGRSASGYESINLSALYANATRLRALALLEAGTNTEEGAAGDAESAVNPMFQEALDLLQEALEIQTALGNLDDAAQIMEKIGVTYHYMGKYTAARTQLQQSSLISEELKDWPGEIQCLTHISTLNAEEGYLYNAVESYKKVLARLPEDRMHDTRAWITYNVAVASSWLSNIDEALEYYHDALNLQRSIDDSHGEAYTLLGIGQTHLSIGELDLAVGFLKRAERLSYGEDEEQLVDGRLREAALRYLGNLEYLQGNYTLALAYHQDALASASSTLFNANLRLLLARDLTALGRYDEAIEMGQQALRPADQIDSQYLRANAKLEIARAGIGLGETQAAKRQLLSVLEIYESLKNPVRKIETMHHLALAERAEGNLGDAINYSGRALEGIESLRGNVTDPELRAFFLSARRSYYETHIDLLMTLHGRASETKNEPLIAAFSVSERARARMILDLLQDASIDLPLGSKSERNERRRQLLTRLAELRYLQNRAMQSSEGGIEASKSFQDTIAELGEVEYELSLIDIEIQRAKTESDEPTLGDVISVEEIQSLLDPGTSLLQFSLGEQNSYAWVISRDRVGGVRLPPRETIEGSVQRVLESLAAPAGILAVRQQQEELLQELARLVLFPLEDLLEGQRLVIAADGGLQYVPFSILPLQSADVGRLLEAYAVVYVPSMSAVAAQRGRTQLESPSKSLLVFADPVFSVDDSRFGSEDSISVSDARDHPLSTRTAFDEIGLSRLPHTGREASVIEALVPDSQRQVFTGFDATRDLLVEMDLSVYKYVHLATHGVIDSRYPSLSALAFSRYDRAGQEREAMLRLGAIYDLRLQADLVVLSACDTALGREVRAEGLVGFTQGFLYAGAKSLIVSLWQVPDRATAELMSRFYRYIFEGGLDPAAALREAKLSLAAERRWREPYYWAAMILVGGM